MALNDLPTREIGNTSGIPNRRYGIHSILKHMSLLGLALKLNLSLARRREAGIIRTATNLEAQSRLTVPADINWLGVGELFGSRVRSTMGWNGNETRSLLWEGQDWGKV